MSIIIVVMSIKRQPIVYSIAFALSSTQAEFIAAEDCCEEILAYIKSFLNELIFCKNINKY